MKQRSQLLLLPFLLLVLPMFAMDSYHLEGTLGKSTIYMQFDDYTKDYPKDEPRITDVRYFYASSLKDIPMEGKREGMKFTFYFDLDGQTFKEKFVLTKNEMGQFIGTWFSAKGKQLPVALRKLRVESIVNKFDHLKTIQALKETNPYQYIRSSKLSFKTDSTSLYEGQRFRWVSEQHCTTFGFYLDSTFSQKTRQYVNPFLEEILLENALNQLSCSSDWEYSKGSDIETDIHFQYLDRNLFSFSIFQSWFCGGFHPDFGKTSYLLDLTNGKNYSLEDLLCFDPSCVVETESNSDAFSTYRSNHVAPIIIQLLVDQDLIDTVFNSEEDPCMEVYNDPQSWTYPDWEYTKNGILFTPYVYRAARACETEPFLIPFKAVEKWKVGTFPYAFP